MSLVYYMPIFLRRKAIEMQDEKLLRWCDIFNLINVNSCFIDRTNSFEHPFETQILYPIPALGKPKPFSELCLERAAELLADGRQITLFYSGGLDSTTVLVALDRCIRDGIGNKDQLVIAATPESIAENRRGWFDLILPNYKIVNTALVLDVDSNARYVQGENSDQLFGPVQQTPMEVSEVPFTPDSLSAFLNSAKVTQHDWLHDSFTRLARSAPIDLPTMRHFLWWVNFTCKWQAVALRTLTITNLLKDGKTTTMDQVNLFDTFFNTVGFQQAAMAGTLSDHNQLHSINTVKKVERDFILEHQPTWVDYAQTKVKMPSLHNVFRLASSNPVKAIQLKDGVFSESQIFDL